MRSVIEETLTLLDHSILPFSWSFETGDRLILRMPVLQFCAMDRSIRGRERLRNADADLAIIADSAGMKRQEGILHDVLWEGVACCQSSFHKAGLVLEGCFDQLVDQIVREIGSPDYKIRHSDGDIVLVQEAVSSSGDLCGAEYRHRFTDGVHLFGRSSGPSSRASWWCRSVMGHPGR